MSAVKRDCNRTILPGQPTSSPCFERRDGNRSTASAGRRRNDRLIRLGGKRTMACTQVLNKSLDQQSLTEGSFAAAESGFSRHR